VRGEGQSTFLRPPDISSGQRATRFGAYPLAAASRTAGIDIRFPP
jgi:hypothetical protein